MLAPGSLELCLVLVSELSLIGPDSLVLARKSRPRPRSGAEFIALYFSNKKPPSAAAWGQLAVFLLEIAVEMPRQIADQIRKMRQKSWALIRAGFLSIVITVGVFSGGVGEPTI